MKRILYVRHGESTANINGVAGVSDAQLTEKGAEQAKITGQHLKNEGVVTIACSPFIRARQTAEIIAQELGYPVYEIVTIDELQERYLGEFEGTTGRPSKFFLNSDNEGGIESRQHMIDRATKAIVKSRLSPKSVAARRSPLLTGRLATTWHKLQKVTLVLRTLAHQLR